MHLNGYAISNRRLSSLFPILSISRHARIIFDITELNNITGLSLQSNLHSLNKSNVNEKTWIRTEVRQPKKKWLTMQVLLAIKYLYRGVSHHWSELKEAAEILL